MQLAGNSKEKCSSKRLVTTVQVVAKSEKGLVRKTNEDRFLATESLLAVADGMGGHLAGDVAAQIAIEKLSEFTAEGDVLSNLKALFLLTNRTIFEQGKYNKEQEGMGTTLTVCCVQGSKGYFGHVGDSRAYLVRDGQVRQLTQDHSYVNQLVVLGTLSQEEAKNHPQRNVLLRALGAQEDIEVDLFEVDFQPGDIVLLATDGLVTDLDKEVLEEILLSEISLEEMADRLLEAALASGGRDNVTVVLGQV
jgi:protein phosphatase